MKYVFQCEKLVRDRAPELMRALGHKFEVETLNRAAHIDALKKKLLEEADEVATACTKKEVIEELADVKEVLDALILKLSISKSELDEIKRKKSLKNGKFDRGIYLKTVEVAHNSKTAQHFLKYPSKYKRLEQCQS